MTKTFYSDSFAIASVEMNKPSIQRYESKTVNGIRVKFLPSDDYLRHQFAAFKKSLSSIQTSGKIIATRLDIQTDSDVIRYLSEN